MKVQRARIYVLLSALVLLFSAGVLIGLVRTNRLSIEHLSSIVTHGPSSQQYHLPADHPRRLLWAAASARSQEDWQTVRELVGDRAALGDPIALRFVLEAARAQGDEREAISVATRLQDWRTLYGIGLSARNKGDADLAIAAYRASWDINPRFAASHLARLLIDDGDLSAAETVLRGAISRVASDDHRQPRWRLELAELLMLQMRWADAITEWERAIALAPLNSRVEEEEARLYSGLAWSLYNDGQVERAITAIDLALQEKPSAGIYLRAGMIYEAAGEPEQALKHYRSALALEPGNVSVQEAIDRLSR